MKNQPNQSQPQTTKKQQPHPVPYERIQTILPVYLDQTGDGTQIYTQDGQTTTLPVPITHFMDQFAKTYFLDPKALKSFFRQKGLTGPLPLYLAGQIFISCKVRKPKISRDPCYGFIAYQAIQDLVPPASFILPHYQIPLACSLATAQKAYNNGILAEKILADYQKKFFQKD